MDPALVAALAATRRRRRGGSSVLFSDLFGREDSDTTLGAAYTVDGDLAWGIQSGKAYLPTVVAPAGGQAVTDVGAANVNYTCDIVLRPGNSTDRGWAVVRSDGTDANRWVVLMDSTTWATLRLLKYEAGVSAQVATGSLSAVIGTSYTIRVVANGSAWEVFVDGASTITATSAVNATLTYCGMAATRTTNGASPTFNNLVVRRAA